MSDTPSRFLQGQGLVGRSAGLGPSPILRGGHALGRKVQSLIADKTDTEPGLARVANEKHARTGSTVLSWTPGGVAVDEVDMSNSRLKHSVSNPALRAAGGHGDDHMKTLQDVIHRHEEKLEQMHQTVLRLQEDRTQQRKTAEKYQKLQARQEQMIQSTLLRTQQLLTEQSLILQRQEVFIQRLERQRGGGLVMGMAYMMVSMYMVETPFAQYVIQLVSRPIMSRSRRARWVPHAVKVLCVIQLVTVFRMLGSTLGWTDRLWLSFTGFMRQFGSLLKSSGSPVNRPSIGNSGAPRGTTTKVEDREGPSGDREGPSGEKLDRH